MFLLQNIPGGIGTSITQGLWYAGLYSSAADFQPWRMLTMMFLHANILHIALNMYAFISLGRILEPATGRLRFAALYFISGFAGSVFLLLLASPLQPSLGASGGIVGLLAAAAVLRRRFDAGLIPSVIVMVIMVAIGFVPGFNIAWQVHLGGIIGGAAVGLVYRLTVKSSTRQWQLPLTLVVVALFALLSLSAF